MSQSTKASVGHLTYVSRKLIGAAKVQHEILDKECSLVLPKKKGLIYRKETYIDFLSKKAGRVAVNFLLIQCHRQFSAFVPNKIFIGVSIYYFCTSYSGLKNPEKVRLKNPICVGKRSSLLIIIQICFLQALHCSEDTSQGPHAGLEMTRQ